MSSSDISAAVVFAAKNSPSFVTQLCSSLEQDAASIEGASAQQILSQASNDFGWYVQRLYPALLAQKFCDATGLAEQHTAISEIVDGFCKNNLHNPQALCAHASALPTYAIVLIALGTLLLGAIVGILLYALWLRHREAQATSFGPSPSYSTSTGTSSSVYQPPSQRAVDLSHGFNTLLNHGDLMPPPQ